MKAALRDSLRRALGLMAAVGLMWLAAGCNPPPAVLPVAQSIDTPTVEVTATAPPPTNTPSPTATTTAVAVSPTPAPSEPTATRDPGEDDMSEYYGGLVITMDTVGQTLTLLRKQGFLLRLGDEFDWKVTFSPPDVVTANRKVSLDEGEQGVFIARRRGKTTLTAIGEPVCRHQQPACARPNVLYKLNIVVE